MKYKCLMLFVSFYYAINLLPACDNHRYTSNPHTWHTRTFQPLLGSIAEGKVKPAEAFKAAVVTLSGQGAPLREAYKELGLDSVQHVDILAKYGQVKGKYFVLDAQITALLEELKTIRNSQQYTASSAEQFQLLRIKQQNEIVDPERSQFVSTLILLFEESGTFWDIALNDYALAPKSKSAIRRDTYDTTHYSQYYLALRELGLEPDHAQAIAMLEMTYDALLCTTCGVW